MTFLYKCRRCGEIDRSTGVGDDTIKGWTIAVNSLVNALHDKQGRVYRTSIHETSIHMCKDNKNACGVSDLIGFEPEK